MTKRYFEFVEGSSSKFWEVWTEGANVKTRYGRIGSSGKITEKNEGDAPGAQMAFERLVAEKTKKGYRELNVKRSPAAAPAPEAVATKPAKAAAKAGKTVALAGKNVVVTGTFAQPRKQLEQRLKSAGCTIGSSVTPKTEVLIVGADAGSKLAAAQKLGIPIITEADIEASLSAAAAKSDAMPAHNAPWAQWQVYSDQLQEQGDARGQVIAIQRELEAKPKDAGLRVAEREALKPLLTGALVDIVAKFDALVAKLKANKNTVPLAYFTHAPVTEREIRKVEQAIGASLHPSILTFFRQTNGLQLYADNTQREEFEDDRHAPISKFDKAARNAMMDYGQDFQLTTGVHIPSLAELFLTTHDEQLWFDFMTDDDTQTFGRKEYPQLSFHKSLRVVDQHNGYYIVGAALIDNPGNPRIGMSSDHGADWDCQKTTDFEGFIKAVLAKDANTDKMVAWFGLG